MSLPSHPVPAQSEGAARRLPVNVFATTSSAVVVAPLPGVMPEHVRVVVSDRQLTITAERDVDADHDYLLHEWNPTGFERTIELPDDVGWPITATVANGQLTITLARRGTRPDDESITIVARRRAPRQHPGRVRRHRPAPDTAGRLIESDRGR